MDLDPSEPGPHFLLGALAAVIDYDWNEAARQFGAEIADHSATPDALWAYAAFYLDPLARSHESAAAMQRAVDQDPLNALLRAVLSVHLNAVGKHDQALHEMQKALEIDDKIWIAHYLHGIIYLQKGRLAEAGLLAASVMLIGEKDRAAALIREMGDSPLLFGAGFCTICSARKRMRPRTGLRR